MSIFLLKILAWSVSIININAYHVQKDIIKMEIHVLAKENTMKFIKVFAV